VTTAAPPREGTGTRDWTPPEGEFRASALGACPRYAWYQMRIPEDERPVEPIGREVMMYAGHAAEHRYFEILNDRGATWTLDYDLDNGYGGICHPDGLDFTRKVVAEIKFTGYKSPAGYHLAQIAWYMHRMAVVTQEPWTGEVHLLDKYGGEPRVTAVPAPDAKLIQHLTRLAELHMAPEPPQGICLTAEDAQDVRYYDVAACGKKSAKGKEIVCPMARFCFPPPDDGMEVW
jgi:hypothetical protein